MPKPNQVELQGDSRRVPRYDSGVVESRLVLEQRAHVRYAAPFLTECILRLLSCVYWMRVR